ncbi:MAG TPA: efflux RND transporter periplasmic adaptor subunit [Chthoniobacterales bacterium]|nr:efflux RND transporter periplasmic adaptor subunit [Chthoniobacterales bacterium]
MRFSCVSLTLFFGAIGLLVSTGCRKDSTSPPVPPPANVRVETVHAKPHVAAEDVVGTVQPKLRSVIEAKISGRIEKMLVVPGQQVKAGELLVQLDSREVQAKLDQAIAVRQQADNDLKRYEILRAKQVITPAEFEAVQSRRQVAVASATETETMLGYTKITAPFDGVVTRKLADVGDLATPGKSLLELEDPRVLQFEAPVPEAVIDKVKLGTRLSVQVLANEIDGAVSEISPSADPNSRTFLIKLDLPSVVGLHAGQFGRVAIPVSETNVLRAPITAVVQRGQMEMVFVVINQHAQLRLVKTGRRFGNEVELLSGVSSGERVITENAASLVDGQPVAPRL